MGEKRLKIIFWTLALTLLVALLLISRDAGISGDEEVHHLHSEMVYNYFSTWGAYTSSLHTPKTHLQYYGQAFDNVVTMLIHWFGVEDVYGFRHLMCSFSGWLTILVTALFAAYFSGYGAAILVVLLFAVSPTFMGHTQNNLKDIPFALAYIASVFYSLKVAFAPGKPSKQTIALLILSIALSIGIRAGGILVVLYFGLFVLLKTIFERLDHTGTDWALLKKRLLLFGGISLSGYFLGLLTWPYALQNPLLNPWKSYQVMAHFPTTLRQIFEGNFEWSDFLPWYYLPKYMAITIPLIVFAGIAAFFLNIRKNYTSGQKMQLWLLGFTILFPIVFVIIKQSNLYGSWRHFLFVYPGIILIAALGLHAFWIRSKNRTIRTATTVLLLVLAFHPLKFAIANHPYYYLYYNQLVGGLKGAYGNYETDYYYHSMREGAEWLQEYLKKKPDTSTKIVGGNFPIQWYFRENEAVKFVYFPYQKRSEYDWDYAIVANSYIPANQLKNNTWPPSNTIHTIYADGIPICAVIERVTKDDFHAIQELEKGNNIKSVPLFQNSVKLDPQNELICYKFATSLLGLGQDSLAREMLEKSIGINPGHEQALTLAGDLALKRRDTATAVDYYKKVIEANRKYLSVYPKLAGIYAETNVDAARKLLHDCLELNARYKPALKLLAETYRETDPEKANKYEKMINKLK